jgi:predicted phage terminase large subunit-like protein
MTLKYKLIPFAISQWAGYQPALHHRLIAAKLQEVVEGKCKRLMIFMPPRHGKSMLASEYLPAYYLGHHPDHYVVCATYGQELADDFGRKVRNLMRDDNYRAILPGVELATDSQASNRFHTTQGGLYYSVGIGGALTGKGAHLLLIDDPVKDRAEAESETSRNKAKDWYRSVARTRLMPDAAIVVIQTRWHEDDLAGWLLKEHQHEDWEVLNLPAIAEPGDTMGRQEGDALWPEHFPLSELSNLKRAVGNRDWASLYQQRPSAAEGGMFKRANWQWYQPQETHPKALVASLGCIRVITAWDTAFKAKQQNDYSVGVTIGITKTRYYVLDVWRDKAEFPDLKRAMVAQFEKWGAHAVVIEDKASGQSLLQELRRETRMPLIALKADTDKVSRANAITAIHESGLVWLPKGEAWAGVLEDECAAFPNAAHDDQVDAFVHAIKYASREMQMAPAMPEPDDDEFPGLNSRYGGSWMS